jgi:hypothetical protein
MDFMRVSRKMLNGVVDLYAVGRFLDAHELRNDDKKMVLRRTPGE